MENKYNTIVEEASSMGLTNFPYKLRYGRNNMEFSLIKIERDRENDVVAAHYKAVGTPQVLVVLND